MLVTKLEEPDVMDTHEFIVGASILAWKWQDHVKHYDLFCEEDLAIMS
jgi:hypothetical protein